MWDTEWNDVRERVLDRDNRTCRNCPTDASDVGRDSLHAHHVRPRAAGAPDEAENCVLLCESCHTRRHGSRTRYLDPEFIQKVRGYGPLTTGEVAEWMTCSRATARRRLDALESSGEVERLHRDGDTLWRRRRSLLERLGAWLSPF